MAISRIYELRQNLFPLQADLVVADITITYEREQVFEIFLLFFIQIVFVCIWWSQGVDFTMPFMNLGVTILYKKPTKKVGFFPPTPSIDHGHHHHQMSKCPTFLSSVFVGIIQTFLAKPEFIFLSSPLIFRNSFSFSPFSSIDTILRLHCNQHNSGSLQLSCFRIQISFPSSPRCPSTCGSTSSPPTSPSPSSSLPSPTSGI